MECFAFVYAWHFQRYPFCGWFTGNPKDKHLGVTYFGICSLFRAEVQRWAVQHWFGHRQCDQRALSITKQISLLPQSLNQVGFVARPHKASKDRQPPTCAEHRFVVPSVPRLCPAVSMVRRTGPGGVAESRVGILRQQALLKALDVLERSAVACVVTAFSWWPLFAIRISHL